MPLPDFASPSSPCIRNCTLDDDSVCVGCGRHIDEIVAWSRLSDPEKRKVLERSERRRQDKRATRQEVTKVNATVNANVSANPSAGLSVVDRIKSQLSGSKVLLYMKGTPDFPQCGFSAAAVQALNAVGAKFDTVNIFEDPELREALKQYSNWPTYPQLYLNGELLGGADII